MRTQNRHASRVCESSKSPFALFGASRSPTMQLCGGTVQTLVVVCTELSDLDCRLVVPWPRPPRPQIPGLCARTTFALIKFAGGKGVTSSFDELDFPFPRAAIRVNAPALTERAEIARRRAVLLFNAPKLRVEAPCSSTRRNRASTRVLLFNAPEAPCSSSTRGSRASTCRALQRAGIARRLAVVLNAPESRVDAPGSSSTRLARRGSSRLRAVRRGD